MGLEWTMIMMMMKNLMGMNQVEIILVENCYGGIGRLLLKLDHETAI